MSCHVTILTLVSNKSDYEQNTGPYIAAGYTTLLYNLVAIVIVRVMEVVVER